MLKKATDRHAAAITNKNLAKQLFSSSPSASNTNLTQSKLGNVASTRPQTLSNGTFNGTTHSSGYHTGPGALSPRKTTAQQSALKRNASGLTKALEGQDAFEDVVYPRLGSQENSNIFAEAYPTAKRNKLTPAKEVFFDENDFDSDINLDVEDPATKGTIKYSHFSPPTSRLHNSSALADNGNRPQSHASATDDSGYVSLGGTKTTSSSNKGSIPPQSSAIPWSSSPPEHFANPSALRQFAYQAPSAPQPVIEPNSSISGKSQTKRRTLPWLEQAADEEPTHDILGAVGKMKRETQRGSVSTPVPKKSHDTTFPWNTTASAVKEQQKKLRETNKKAVKTHEATGKGVVEELGKGKKAMHDIFLSEEQHHVLDLVMDGKKSVFFTGSAGTGKSVLLRHIIKKLKEKFKRDSDRVAVTASTGLAACNIGGSTIHSFAGIGLGKEEVPELVKKIRRNQKAKHRWMRTKVLIVDEVSMVDGDMFDKLEAIARILRNNGRPFGGIQLVITGDFFQLPPVPENSKRAAKFCFDAQTWNTTIEHTIGLHKVFRQKDPEFAAMLNEMREGRLSAASIAKFKSLSRDLRFEDQIDATELFPTRAEVDNANNVRMQNLQGQVREYLARDGGTTQEKTFRDRALASCMAPERIVLKKGAQVMLIKNIDDTLVNGSLGKVIGFMSEQTWDNYVEHEEDYYATQRDPNEEGPPGLSERKTELVANTAQLYPVVRFAIADGTTRDLLLQRESWKVELPNGEVVASRAQIPLILAWALSIHKAQGQTLERVKVDLGKVFEKGQAYVALSRATTIAGLQVLRFDASRVLAHDRVRNFYNSLSRADAQPAAEKA